MTLINVEDNFLIFQNEPLYASRFLTTSYELRIPNYELWITSYELKM